MAGHIEILNSEWKKRKDSNSHFSLRRFANFLDVNPSGLSEFLAGKKGFSKETLLKITKKLELSEEQSDLFIISVLAKHAKSIKARQESRNQLPSLQKIAWRLRTRSAVEENIFSNWLSFAILECMTGVPPIVRTRI